VNLLPSGCALVDDRVNLAQQVKAANDIVDVVGGYLSLRPAGAIFKGLCPFHEDHNPSMNVDPRQQRFKCWACGKYGDVIDFVQELERVSFLEALELLARRAGISLKKGSSSAHEPTRAFMLEVMQWAAQQFQECLLDSPLAEAARKYLGERRLSGEIVRRFGLGYAPAAGEWLVRRAADAGHPADMLEKVGLIAKRNEGNGYYDRFRDRVIFPIRDGRGQTVGFGGRILPSSPLMAAKPPKYYNSAETVLFSKSRQLYGIDQARQSGVQSGCLVVVEGYTDVLMAHQEGMTNVVATMGTALNDRHVEQMRRLVNKVVLVFDADQGGEAGVDRALEVFVRHDLDLRVATLPDGLDPCDLLAERGPEEFQSALAGAVDVLEFKLNRVWAREGPGVEGRRRAVDAVLGVLALVPDTRSVKLELMVNRIAFRAGLKEETVWERLKQLRDRKAESRPEVQRPAESAGESAPAAIHEVELLEVLLAEPALVEQARAALGPEQIEHAGLRRLAEGLFALEAAGLPPDLDHLRARLDHAALLNWARKCQERGLAKPDRAACLRDILARFRHLQQARMKLELQSQLHAAADHDSAIALLRRLQNQTRV
jgi:DNA primase